MKTYTIYGNCQSTIIASCLARVVNFNDRYKYVRQPYCHRISKIQYEQLKISIIDYDLLIAQPVSNQFRGGGFGSGELQSRCENNILFPSLQFYGYFPSLSRLTIPKETKAKADELKLLLKAYPPLTTDSLYHYNEIRVMMREELNSSDICKRLDAGSATEFNLEKVLNQSLNILREKEAENIDMVGIAAFIQSQWGCHHLFYTPRHPSGIILAEVTKKIVEKLGLTITNQEYSQIAKRDHFSALKLYIPAWIRKNYLASMNIELAEADFSLSCADTVSLFSKIYCLFPELL